MLVSTARCFGEVIQWQALQGERQGGQRESATVGERFKQDEAGEREKGHETKEEKRLSRTQIKGGRGDKNEMIIRGEDRTESPLQSDREKSPVFERDDVIPDPLTSPSLSRLVLPASVHHSHTYTHNLMYSYRRECKMAVALTTASGRSPLDKFSKLVLRLPVCPKKELDALWIRFLQQSVLLVKRIRRRQLMMTERDRDVSVCT